MISEWPLLSLTTFLPLAGALAILLFVRGATAEAARNARWTALWISGVTFALSLLLWGGFEAGAPGFQFQEVYPWLPGFGISYHLGVDGVSLFFVLLATLLTPICILASWKSITKNVAAYMVSFLVLETMMVGMFSSLDMLLFYIFFEGVLIPMFVIIGVWGGGDESTRRSSSFSIRSLVPF